MGANGCERHGTTFLVVDRRAPSGRAIGTLLPISGMRDLPLARHGTPR